MTTTKSLSKLLVAVALGCSWVSCDSESDSYDEPIENEPIINTSFNPIEIALQNVVQAFCAADSTLEDKLAMNATFEPDYGMVLYSVTPTVRYVTAEDGAYARDLFMSKFLPAILCTNTDTTGTAILIDLGKYGKVEFTSMQKEGSVATIDVDVTSIPNLSQVVFVRPEALPQNPGDGQLTLGTVLRKNGRYWICIRQANNGGLLVTFDRKDGHPFVGGDGDHEPKPTFVNDPFVEYCQTTKTNWYPKYVVADNKERSINNHSHVCFGFPSVDQLDLLRDFLFDSSGQPLQRAIDALTLALKNRGGEAVYNKVFADGTVFCCGEGASATTGPLRYYHYEKYCTKYWFRPKGWYEFECDYNSKACVTSWYVSHKNWREHFYENRENGGWWETYNLQGSYPRDCIDQPLNFIRTEMMTFDDRTLFYDPKTLESYDGWEIVE